VSATFTQEITDGIHGAILKARTATDPATKGLPVVEPAKSARTRSCVARART
jgi:hypothetical protein